MRGGLDRAQFPARDSGLIELLKPIGLKPITTAQGSLSFSAAHLLLQWSKMTMPV